MFKSLFNKLYDNMGYSKYDYHGPSEKYNLKTLLLSDRNLEMKSSEDIDKQKETMTFATLYAGRDPIDSSSMLIKQIISMPVDYDKYKSS